MAGGGPIIGGPGTHVIGGHGGIAGAIRRKSALIAMDQATIYRRARARITFPRRRQPLQGGGYGLDIDNARVFGAIRIGKFSTTVDPRLTLE